MGPAMSLVHPEVAGYRSRTPIRAEGLGLSWSDVFSIEACLVLFLFSGRYKTMPEFQGFPVDFTALFLVLTLALIVGGFLSGQLKLPAMGIAGISFLLFAEFASISVFWSSLGGLNLDKLQRFVMLTAPSFYMAAILTDNPIRRLRLLRLIVWFSLAFVVRYYYYRYVIGIDLVSSETGAVTWLPADNNTYLDYSGHAAILFIIFFSSAMYRGWRNFWLGFVGMACALLALADIGGRGPLVMAILTMPIAALMLVVRRRDARTGFLRVALLTGLLFGGGIFAVTAASITSSQFRTIERFELQISNEDTSSMDERNQGQALAYTMWLQRPLFGWGIGEFRVWDSYLNYPHNLFLEILTELGIVGGALFAVTALATICRVAGRVRHSTWSWVDASFAFLFITELITHLTVQGYLADDRVFFSYLAINLVATSNSRLPQVRP